MRQVVPGRGRRGGSDWRASASCARNETPLRFTAAWPARRTRATPTEPVAGRRGPGGRTPRRRHTTSRARSEQPRRRRATRHARARIRTKCDAPGDPGAPRTPRAEGARGGAAAAAEPRRRSLWKIRPRLGSARNQPRAKRRLLARLGRGNPAAPPPRRHARHGGLAARSEAPAGRRWRRSRAAEA